MDVVRGQRLFIRPIESGDAESVRLFFAANAKADDAPSMGLIGKLVGDLVAVLAMEITIDAVRISNLFVARELRRKRIGRFMVDELARLAKKIDRDRIVVEPPADARDFFRKIGFDESERQMVRVLR
jgi:GNAT superfamily N-acetyltransferase